MQQPPPVCHRRPPLRPLHAAVVAVVVGLIVGAAAQGRAEEQPDPRKAINPGLVPFVPQAVSRPDGWPGAAAGEAVASALREQNVEPQEPAADGSVDAERHVLSSIRDTPGGPLRAPSGVVQAAYEEEAGAALPEAVPLEGARVVARVGPEVVLESDLLTPKAVEWLATVSPGLAVEQVRELRTQICQQVIAQHIDTLLVYVDACREIPPDKLPEVRQNVDKAFDEQMLPNLMEEAGVGNGADFDDYLRSRGQSLDTMRKMFFERGLAQEWLRKNVREGEEIPHADMIAWYQAHLADYEFPAKARFEALTVKTGLKRSRQQAWDILASMGNEVLAGRPFVEVAQARSEGPTARDGGRFDWTSKGSLASKLLDEAIFTLPVGQLSAIIEEQESLHIVRVTERNEAGRTPFLDAQTGIRDTLQQQRQKKQMEEYLGRLRSRTPVWTVFDGQLNGPRSMTAGRPVGGGTKTR